MCSCIFGNAVEMISRLLGDPLANIIDTFDSFSAKGSNILHEYCQLNSLCDYMILKL